MNQEDRHLLHLRATYSLRLLSSRLFPGAFLNGDVTVVAPRLRQLRCPGT